MSKKGLRFAEKDALNEAAGWSELKEVQKVQKHDHGPDQLQMTTGGIAEPCVMGALQRYPEIEFSSLSN